MRNLTQQLRQFGRADEGTALVLIALALVVLVLVAGLAVDVSYLRYRKQEMQKAADAGALAGASALIYGGKWKAAAQADASANGFTDGRDGTTVTVNNPPAAPDPYAGNSNYVEVVVAQPQPTFFMRVGGFTSVPVRSRAVAGVGSASGCIYALNPTVFDSYKAAGTTAVTSKCGILVYSQSPRAFDDDGSARTQASGIGITGGVDHDAWSSPAQGSSGFVTGMAALGDPLAELTEPTPDLDHCRTDGKITGGTWTLSAGTYCGGIQISGSNPNVTFSPGTYILYGGGLSINAQATITGNGVTFYNTGRANGKYAFQSITINGGSGITLSAPTSGPMEGILFFEDRHPQANGAITNLITGASGASFVGALYFSSTAVTYAGGTIDGAYTILVADTLNFVGNSILNDDYSSLDGGGSPIHSAVVVE